MKQSSNKKNNKRKKEKKKAARERARQRRAQTIQLSLTEKKHPQEEKEAKLLELKKAKSPGSSSLVLQEPEESEPIRFEEPFVSHEQSKREKEQRHAEAQAKRDQDAALEEESEEKETSALVPVARKVSKEEQLESILASSDKPLSELYNLSSLPLRVDQEIEEGTWRFTREDLKIYLEAMGCTYKDGRGSHAKGSLPKAIHVMQGSNRITIWNDFGGALTLPLWDKDYVPSYLKTQILEARKQLRALKIIALQKSSDLSSSS